VVGTMHQDPWEAWPMGFSIEPPLHPVPVYFWQRGWFQLTLFFIALAALAICLWLMTQLAAQAQTQNFLQIERARIARDIHDDLGAQLTQLVLLGEVAQREQPSDSTAQEQFRQLCARAREISHAMDEVVWAVNSRRDTVRDFVSYVCKYAQLFFSATTIRCRLDVAPEIPEAAFDLPIRRNLFLAVKEALNNAAKYSQAEELFVRIFFHEQQLTVMVEDNGVGFDPAQVAGERNGLANMPQRMAEAGGQFSLISQPGAGCVITFTVPLHSARGWLRFFWKRSTRENAETTEMV